MVSSIGKFWLPDFDPEGFFIVHQWPRGHTVDGVEPRRGTLVDKTKFPEKQLRNMYERRWIAMVDESEIPKLRDPSMADAVQLQLNFLSLAEINQQAIQERSGR